MTEEPSRRRRTLPGRCAPYLFLCVLLAGAASAQQADPPPDRVDAERLAAPPESRPPTRGRRGPPPLDRILEENAERLGLSQETRDQIRERSVDTRERTREQRSELRDLHDQMRDLLGQEAPDEAQVMAHAEQIGALETALQKERLRTMLAIRAMLTPEQRSELVRIHQERRSKRGVRRGGPGPSRRSPPPDH